MNPVLYGELIFEQELNALFANADLTDEEREAMENALVEHHTQSVEKIDGLMKYTVNLESFQESAKAEEDRIRARRKAAERISDKIKQGIKNYMLAKGLDTLQAGTFKLSMRKSTTVELDDIKAVPNEFKVVTISETVDKMKVKEAWKAGKDVSGVHAQENRNLQIK